MARSDEDLLRAARDEAYHLRVVTRQLRNQTKTLAGAYSDSERRLEGLIEEIEARLNGSPRQGGSGNDHQAEDRFQDRVAAA